MAEQRTGAQLYLLVTMVFFGAAFTSSKVVVGELPHDAAAALRFGGGALVLLLMLLLRPGSGRFSGRELVRAGSVGLIGVFGYNFLFFWGLSLAPAIDGSVIVPVLSPVLTTVVLLVTKREKASAARITGLVLGVAGAVVFFLGIGGGSAVTGSRLTGDLIYLACAACWAAYSIASKQVLSGMEPLRATTYATGAGALALVLTAIPALSTTDFSAVSGPVWGNLVFLAIGPTAIAYLFYYRGLRAVSPVTATVTMFAVPVFGTVFSVLFLHESFTSEQIVGAVITVFGALLAVTQGRRPSRACDHDEVTGSPVLRAAVRADVPRIAELMRESVLDVFPRFHDERETAAAAECLTEPDTMLIDDGTYFVHEANGQLVACGGWSKRDKLYTGSGDAPTDARLLDPATEPARVRAMFVRAGWTRRGLGRAILARCEQAARAQGYRGLALMATLPGEPLYRSYGFREVARVDVPLRNGVVLPGVEMDYPLTD